MTHAEFILCVQYLMVHGIALSIMGLGVELILYFETL